MAFALADGNTELFGRKELLGKNKETTHQVKASALTGPLEGPRIDL
jgi:hypothetical protein